MIDFKLTKKKVMGITYEKNVPWSFRFTGVRLLMEK